MHVVPSSARRRWDRASAVVSFLLMTACSTASAALSASPPAQNADAKGAFPDRLTVDQAVRIGLERNPQVAASVAGLASAAASYRSLAAFPNLTLGVSHVNGSSSAPTLNGTTNDTFLDFGETLDTSGQRRFQAASAKAQREVARYQLEETKLMLAQQIRDAYWSLASARDQAQIARDSLQDAQRVYQLTRTQLDAGASPRVDVIRSSIDLANVQQSAVTAVGAERAAVMALNVLLARPPTAPIELANRLSEGVTPVAATTLPGLAELTRTALAQRPLVKSAKAQVDAAEYALKQARAARLPDLSVDYQRSVKQPVDSFILTLNAPLLDFGSVRHAVHAAEESKRQAEAQERQAEQQVAQAVAQAYLDYTQAQQLTASYQAEILTPSVTLLSSAQLGYKQGATGILPVLDAETTLRNARTGYINSLLALSKAQDELQAATGGAALPATSAAK